MPQSSLRKTVRGYLLVVAVLLFFSVQLSWASPQPSAKAAATTTRKSTSTKKTTKPTTSSTTTKSTTSTKTTSTTTTPTTTSTTTTKSSTTTTKSTTTKAAYTWKAVSSKPNCAPYNPTSTFASQTVSSAGTIATAFVDVLGGGKVPPQIGIQTSGGDSLIVKTLNQSSLIIFKPGTYVAYVDSDGILVYDPQCQQGARLRVPNFIAFPASTPARLSRVRAKRAQLATRAASPTFNVDFSFKNDCGRDVNEQIQSINSSFSCGCFPQKIPGSMTVEDSTYASGAYIASVTPPAVDASGCGRGVDAVTAWIQGEPDPKALDAAKELLKQGEDRREVDALLKQFGIPAATDFVDGTLAQILSGARAFLSAGGNQKAKDGLCALGGFTFEMKATTDHFNLLSVNTQSGPFKSMSAGPFIVPSVERCNGQCTNLSTDPKNCAVCGNVCAGNARCYKGVCKPGPFCTKPFNCYGNNNPGDCNGGQTDGPLGTNCLCWDIEGVTAGDGVCNIDGYCKDYQTCSIDTLSADCPQGSICSLNSCCGPICFVPATRCGNPSAARILFHPKKRPGHASLGMSLAPGSSEMTASGMPLVGI